jgi:hypothetical protein
MQNPTNVSSIGTGIVPPPVSPQQLLHMQSTTPSVANGKDEIRGWLYKWTNVNFYFLSEKKIVLFLVFKRLSKTLVCFTSWYTFLLSFSR